MGIITTDEKHYRSIANTIRRYNTNVNYLMTPSKIAELAPTLYTTGQSKGYNSGYSSGYSSGYIEGRDIMISRKLTEISDTSLTNVGNYAFAGMPIKSMNLPKVNTVGKYGFRGCIYLTEIDLPNLQRLSGKGEYAFGYCQEVTRYNLPRLATDSTSSTYAELRQTFEGNYSLERIELKNEIVIGTKCFYNCKVLKALILGDSASLNSTDAFDKTPIQSGTGYIYVPDNKVNAYKKATNWSLFASQIKGYSELPAG